MYKEVLSFDKISLYGKIWIFGISLIVSWLSASNSFIFSISLPNNSILIGFSQLYGNKSITNPLTEYSPDDVTIDVFV